MDSRVRKGIGSGRGPSEIEEINVEATILRSQPTRDMGAPADPMRVNPQRSVSLKQVQFQPKIAIPSPNPRS